jgi:hypothetical protein
MPATTRTSTRNATQASIAKKTISKQQRASRLYRNVPIPVYKYYVVTQNLLQNEVRDQTAHLPNLIRKEIKWELGDRAFLYRDVLDLQEGQRAAVEDLNYLSKKILNGLDELRLEQQRTSEENRRFQDVTMERLRALEDLVMPMQPPTPPAILPPPNRIPAAAVVLPLLPPVNPVNLTCAESVPTPGTPDTQEWSEDELTEDEDSAEEGEIRFDRIPEGEDGYSAEQPMEC